MEANPCDATKPERKLLTASFIQTLCKPLYDPPNSLLKWSGQGLYVDYIGEKSVAQTG